jgi:heme exporter protein C
MIMRKAFVPLLAIAGFLLMTAPLLIARARFESTMGLVQKIFYYHMPAAMTFLVSAIVCGYASIRYLFGGNPRHDRLGYAAAELTVLFGIIALVTGPLWARKAWGVWWVWDPRLTSSLLVWMIFAGYLLLRRYGGPGSDKLGAGMALFGMAVVPFVYVSVNYWRTMHPQTSVVPTLPVSMGGPLWFCFAAMFLLFLVMMSLRVGLERQRARLEALYLSEDER